MCPRRAVNVESIDDFQEFYAEYYHEEIEQLVENYPQKQRSLYLDWRDVDRFDTELADDYINYPKQVREYAEEALRLHELSEPAGLGRAHVRINNCPHTTSIDDLGAQQLGQLRQIEGWIHDTTPSSPRVVEAAFECQRCGTLTRIPQTNEGFQKPHKCQGCERKGPFVLNHDQSEFSDFQRATLRNDAVMTNQITPTREIELRLEDDIAGMISREDHVCVVGVYLFEQINDKSAIHEPYLAVESIEQTVPYSITASESWLTDGTDSYSDSADSVSSTALEAYVIRSQQVINRSPTMSETNVKTKLVTPFIDLLGWNIYSPEVELEYPTQSGSSEKRVDYLLCSNEVPAICVEAKSLQKSIDRYVGQLSSYMRQVGADWGLLTSGERMKLLQTDFDADHPNERVVVDCSIVQLVEKREMFENITKSAVRTG